MLKKIITKVNKTISVGRGVEEGKIMMVSNSFTLTREGDYSIVTTSYLVNEDAENVSNVYPCMVEGFEIYKIKFIDTKTTIYDADAVQGLFLGVNNEILLTGDFTVQLTDLLNNALLLVVASENTFNVGGVDDWEFID